MYNQLNISSGHSVNCKGANCYIDEVTEAKKVVNRLKEICEKVGVDCYVYHDTSNSVSVNLQNIVNWHNKFKDGLDISIHFNACSKTDNDRGCEVWCYSQSNFEQKLVNDICKVTNLVNRGVKLSQGLYFLKNTKKKSILIEICFVDSKADVMKYNANFEYMCRAIVTSLTGKVYADSENDKKQNNTNNDKMYYVQVGAFKNIDNAKKLQTELKAKGFDSAIK